MTKSIFLAIFSILCSAFCFAGNSKGPVPNKLQVEIINSSTVKLTWVGSVKDHGYRVRSREVGSRTWTYYTVQAPTCVRRLSNLKPATKYEWHVQTMFSDSKRDTSMAAVGPEFITDSNCDKPENLQAEVLNSYKAILHWEKTTSIALYEVKLKTSSDTEWVTYHTNSSNLIVDNLKLSTSYEWKVVAYCGGDKTGIHSDYSDTSRFVTGGEETSGDIVPQKISNYENNSWQNSADINYITFSHDGNTETANTKATITSSVGQVENLSLYYKSTNGEIAFDINDSLPPGIYSIEYVSGRKLYSKTILIAAQ